METPSSTARRVTRSQTSTTLAASNNIPVSRKMEDSEKNLSKSRQRKCQNQQQQQQQQDRCALVDISNDSPIVGLASGILETPLSSIVKQRGSRVKKTPGSGEALLRGQVKTLLQKVEEEAEISKLSMDIDIRPFLQQLANSSPMSLLAPTPANTPQIPNINNTATGLASVSPISVVQEQLISQVVNEIVDGKNKEDPESEKTMLSRSLLLDFSDKSEVSECFSELTEVTQGDSSGSYVEKPQGSTEDDGDSVWSMQVNASSTHDDEDDEEEEEEIAENEDDEEEDYYEGVEEEEEYGDDDEEGLDLDELCAGLNNISVNEKVAPAGKHTRFVYDSDEEIVEEVEVLHLKGLPTPKGKHIRFPDEEEKSAF